METEIWNQDVAVGYDAASSEMYAPGVLLPTVDFLAGLAPGGRALEFAIGTGRVALPLAARGVEVAGIDSSQAMVNVLRGKPGGCDLHVVVGDMTTTSVPGAFDLVYVVYNAITCLLTQAEQVECFRNAYRHLRPGGHFVAEVFIPDLRRLPVGAKALAYRVDEDRFSFDTYDVVRQHVVSHHYQIKGGHAEAFHSPHRYLWPAEMDLMGEIADLRLAERWADWNRGAFTEDSSSQISVWAKAD